MNKEDLLKDIAQVGYNTSYGCNKHYSTADLVGKGPNRFGAISLIIGIAAIAYPILGSKPIGVIMTIMSVLFLYTNTYQEKLDQYFATATQLEDIFSKLSRLYTKLKSITTPSSQQIADCEKELKKLETEMRTVTMYKQIFGSNFTAHIKMFWTKRTNNEWYLRELNLTIVDQLPLSVWVMMITVFIFGLGLGTGVVIPYFKSFFHLLNS